jgi:hypothetical protein
MGGSNHKTFLRLANVASGKIGALTFGASAFRGFMNSDLVEFVETSFRSVWSLELLLLLYRDPSRTWTSDELVHELRSSEVVVAQSIERLVAAGLALAEKDDCVRYGPASPEQNDLVAQLQEEYRRKPAAIRRLILQNPVEKLRTFADAFKLKKS